MPRHNPFNYGTPVPPNKLVGRKLQVQIVADELLNPSGQSYAIIGGKRCGKSSFLEAVQHDLVVCLSHASEEGRYVVPLLINLKRLSVAPQETEVFGLILQLLYRQFTSKREQMRIGIDLPLDLTGTRLQLFAQSKQIACSLDEFTSILEDFLDRFDQTYNRLRLVLLIDEVDILADRDWASVLFSNLRSAIYEGSLKAELRYVLAGSSRVIDLREAGSPFFNMLDVVHLHSLSDEDVDEMMAWAGDVPESVASAVRRLCGGHPYLVQYIMKNLWEGDMSKATPESVAAQARKFTIEHQAELLTWLVDIDQRGKDAYQTLAQTNDWLSFEEIHQALAQPGDAYAGVVRLCYHGLAVQKDTYGFFKYSGDLFKNWFLTLFPPAKDGKMTTFNLDFNRKTRTRLLEQRIEEYHAVNAQLAGELSAVNRKPLERQAEELEPEIEQLRRELGLAEAQPQPIASPDPGGNTPGTPSTSLPMQVLKLQLSLAPIGKIQVRGLTVPGGGIPIAESELPFSWDHLQAINKALDMGEFRNEHFRAEYVEALVAEGLLIGDVLHPDLHATIGQRLYNVLFTGDIATEWEIARRSGSSVGCQLCFDPGDVLLAQFPWELIYGGGKHWALIKKGIELTRSIQFGLPPAPLQTNLPLRVLIVNPRPTGEENQPDGVEADALLAGLKPLEDAGQMSWTQLRPATWKQLKMILDDHDYHIIHFDGHGSFSRICPFPECATPHFPGVLTCTQCERDMSAVTPKGYLHFESDESGLDRVSVDELSMLLANSGTRLVVLSACGSGVVKGTSVFNGIGPGLIQAGIPAVVAMQGSPPASSSVEFFQQFYHDLAQGMRVPTAVNSGRLTIMRNKPAMWFMPVVYLRSSDNSYGQLFKL